MKSFMEEVNWRGTSGSTPVGEWREEGWIEGEVELSCSCSRSLCLSCGRSGTKMVLQNYPTLGRGARTLYPCLNLHWPVIGCRLQCEGVTLGKEVPVKELSWELSAAHTPSSWGSERRIWAAHYSDHYRWNQGFESCVYERVMVLDHSTTAYLVPSNWVGA